MSHHRSRSRRLCAVATIAATLMLGACGSTTPTADRAGDDFVLAGVSGLTQVAQLTGPGAINDTEKVGVAGTDLGSMVNVGDRTYFFFGDTFGERGPDSYGGQGGAWRSNVSAWTTDDDPSDGITFGGWAPVDEFDWAAPLIEGDHDANDGGGEVTKIPTYGFAVGDAMYVGYMSVNHWGDPGVWEANHAGMVVSRDGGASWTDLPDVRWPGDSNFVQLATAHVMDAGAEYVYLWGIPAGRFGGVELMRVPASTTAVEDIAAYTYFAGTDETGTPQWSADPDAAETIVDPTVGELSVMWSEYLQRWVMTYSDAGSAYIREGLAPWGPWGEPIEMVSADDYPGLYSPYLNPRYTDDGGRRLYFTLSLWGPYNVFWFSVDLDKAD
ncbi:MAG: DUF4185 domain-containing protein [Microbacterium sp.]|uniref:DUF4185 domain-containing protein n=1 Tax=Microbacterium sp. TaxID=51671 RepID=UPI001AC7E371|nr:DUF4185 domain-containing protein [Microbacterium sp.]MBN9177506.1 DUF4185 domain-containing protein [Microbacterium sp.]